MTEDTLGFGEAADFEALVRRAIRETVRGNTPDRDAPLTDAGVTSLALFDFVGRLEELANVQIPDDHLRPENFATVGTVVELLERLAGQSGTVPT